MTKFAGHVIDMCDEKVSSDIHIDTLYLDISTTVIDGKIGSVQVYKYWEYPATKVILDRHPAAIWTRLSMKMAQGTGLFGRAVTLHYGWSHEAVAAPTTLTEMSKLYGYQCHVFGGVFSLTDEQVTIAAPFNSARSNVAKVNQFVVGGRIVMFYFFQESKLGTSQAEGPRISFRFDGQFDLYDRN